MRGLILTLALGLGASAACKPDEAPTVAVAAKLLVAPVADDHPWVIAFLTEVSIQRPPGADARLEGRTEPDGRYVPDPVFEAETRAALEGFLRAYEQDHPRPAELSPVWEPHPDDPPRFQLHFVDSQAGFWVDREASAKLEPSAAGPVVVLMFSRPQAERFTALTDAHAGHRVAFVIGDEVVSVPIVRDAISTGEVQLRSNTRDPAEVAAPALLDRLKQPN